MIIQANGFRYKDLGILLMGPPGIGKTGLMLEAIQNGAELIGDDGVVLSSLENQIMMAPVPATKGLVELRGLGIIQMECCGLAKVDLILSAVKKVDVLAQENCYQQLLDQRIPVHQMLMDPYSFVRLTYFLEQYDHEHGLSHLAQKY